MMMKLFYRTTFLMLVLLQGCQNPAKLADLNQFSSANDTLVIRTEKVKGSGLFPLAVGPLVFKDTVEAFQYPVIFPKQVSNVKRVQMSTDFAAQEAHFIDIMSGWKDQEKIFIVDQNSNKDFTDDPVRTFQEIEWYSSENSIKCKYLIYNGQKVVQDSSWVQIGTTRNGLGYGRDEHLSADFRLDENHYKIGIIDQMLAMTFTYGANPEIALIADNANVKDTLLHRDRIRKGEYLNLADTYYRFDSITNNGEYITLVKEVDFKNITGTQIGMIAPDFKAISVQGDTMNSVNLNDKVTVIANSCGCGGDTLSTEAFFNLTNTFGEEIYALRLDFGIDSDLAGRHFDMKEEYNKDVYNKYRQAYCSRTAYVIGKNKRILDKFRIKDWASFLPEHVPAPVDATNR